MIFHLSLIAISLIFSAFFSGMEIAFISANKLHIELQSKQGNYISKILSKFTKNESRFIGTLLIGNNIALVIYGIMMAKVLKPIIINILPSLLLNQFWILLAQTLVSTLIILVTAEFIPKTIFRINPNLTLSFFAIPALIAYSIFYVPVLFIIGFSEFILKQLFNVNFDDNTAVFGRVDLDNYVRNFISQEKNELEPDVQMFQNALDFKDVKIKECMIPRTEIEAIEVNDSIESLHKLFTQSGYSKILIYRDQIDNIIGFCHQSAMFKQPKSIGEALMPVPYVSESMLANDLLTRFIQQRKSIAVVVDEFGGTSGIVTMEDVVEEIFGEIEDEHDGDTLVEKQINPNEFVFSAKHKVEYLNETFNLNIPEADEYETLAGYIVHYYQNLPKAKEIININGFKITVLRVSKTRIDLVKFSVKG